MAPFLDPTRFLNWLMAAIVLTMLANGVAIVDLVASRNNRVCG
jgi:hypothetical protein